MVLKERIMSNLNKATMPIEGTNNQHRGLTTEVSKIIVEEVANALRHEWKEELEENLRERARKGFFKQ